jgi:hypothetical protein
MWIEKPRRERAEDVHFIVNMIRQDTPDRFWFSDEQDGPDVQLLRVKLPVIEDDVLYDIVLITAQLKAAQLIAYDMGQRPGDRLAATPTLLNRLNIIREESFEIRNNHTDGIAIEIIVDEDGITHSLVDDLLGKFKRNGYVPLMMRSINPMTLAQRIIQARDDKKLDNYVLV